MVLAGVGALPQQRGPFPHSFSLWKEGHTLKGGMAGKSSSRSGEGLKGSLADLAWGRLPPIRQVEWTNMDGTPAAAKDGAGVLFVGPRAQHAN